MASTEPFVGSHISHYRVLAKLGEGGMGVVYKAEDTHLQRFAALKFLPKDIAHDKQMRELFLREARAASALNHPNICTIYGIEETDDRIFIAMEFLDGQTLRELVRCGPLRIEQLLDIGLQIIEGVEIAHSEGVIHRDLKLGNIFITKSGRVKILDFGLAKKSVPRSNPEVAGPTQRIDPAEEQLTSGLGALGTAAYMSPEQALGRPLDTRTDLFSFGIVLYQMATGRAPFSGDTTGLLLLSIVEEQPPPLREFNSGLPAALQEVIDRCLQKSREFRYQTAAEIRRDLQELQRNNDGLQPARSPLNELASVPSQSSPPDISPLPSERRPTAALTNASAQKVPRRFVSRPWKVGFVLTALVLAVFLSVRLYVRRQGTHTLTPRDTAVLADFTNTTGDPIFDGTLKQAVRIDLEQSPLLNLLPDGRVTEVLQQMGRSPNQRLTIEVSREVCLRSNSRVLIVGSITSEDSRYLVELQALACDSGSEVSASQVAAANRSEVLHALSVADKQLRSKLGESLHSIEKLNKPLEEATTSSLEALKEYTTGIATYDSSSSAEAIPHLQQAVRLDPNFALASSRLGTIYLDSGESLLADENLSKAYDLRDRVSEFERFIIDINYYGLVRGQMNETIEICKNWVRLYPETYIAHANLGRAYQAAGQFENALQEYQHAIQMAPDRSGAYVNAMLAYKNLERYDEAKAVFKAALAHNLDNDPLRIGRYTIAFLEGDTASMQEQLNWAASKPGSGDRLMKDWADAEAYYGRFAKARVLDKNAQAEALKSGAKGRYLEHRAFSTLREAEVGNVDLVRRYATPELTASHGINVKIITALALAKIGENAFAERLAQELGHDRPIDTMTQDYYVPMIRAIVALNKHKPDDAIAFLASTRSLDNIDPFLDGLEPTYIRGQAYLQKKQGREAAVEFQKLLDHPGMVNLSIRGALAHLQLARANKLSGDQSSARKNCQDFLALWKDADPELPLLKQAQLEYAKLR